MTGEDAFQTLFDFDDPPLPPDDEEFLLSDQEDSDIEFSLEVPDARALQVIVNTYSAFMCGAPAVLSGTGMITLSLPRTFLPLSLQAVYGFTKHPDLLTLKLRLKDSDWTFKPDFVEILHPLYGSNFIGKALIDTVVTDFFTTAYRPRQLYRSESYLLAPTGTADMAKLEQLVGRGYEEKKAQNALVICRNSLEQAISYLRTGDVPQYESQIHIGCHECPLLYLVLEICECFFDLSDHCCICRSELDPGLKPSVCAKQLCQFQFTTIGVGNSVIQEIRQDPLVADLMVSIFSAAIRTQYLTPAPPGLQVDEMIQIVERLPPTIVMARKYENDRALSSAIGPPALQLLRWILLSSRSHLISLPQTLRLAEFGSARQFMTLISSPEAEREFRKLKEKFGSMFLFHGSDGTRWHSIIRNGLKNATGTDMQANGAVLGAGIYFARSSDISLSYAKEATNRYEKSGFGRKLKITAICEVAMDPSLQDHKWAHTLQNEKACIVRFLLVNGMFRVDLVETPITRVPKLREVLDTHADDAQG
jgi:poly [ADP-ribose] polymerase 6/8